ncbi:MAG: hypothetical protein KBD78_10560 [Oligoflexales bacterium]|nr:hypothetical protein [Oligoflexales bacterium]
MGKDLWKYGSGYTKRSLVETAIYRYKQTNGDRLHSKKLVNQQTEIRIGAKILNKMTRLWMAKSYKIKKSRKTYGVPRMLKALLAKGYKIGKEKFADAYNWSQTKC